MAKINTIKITGLRGVRNDLTIPLDKYSALLYGDNGSGKSTLSDVLEWFFYDEIDHLKSDEIGKKGVQALRNIFLDDNEQSALTLAFSDKNYDSEKHLTLSDDKYTSHFSNTSEEFTNYLEMSQQENLILRYKDLMKFVLSTKADKLKTLSDIMGYAQIEKIKKTFNTICNRLSREIRSKNFDNQINQQQSVIIEQLSQNTTTDEQFINCIQNLIKPLKLDINIVALKDINSLLQKLKTSDDSKQLKQEIFLIKIQENLPQITGHLDVLQQLYSEYNKKFEAIVSDIEKIKKLDIENLLTAGEQILSNSHYTQNSCPLCLGDKHKETLILEIKYRKEELNAIKKEQQELQKAKNILQNQITSSLNLLGQILNDQLIKDESNKFLQEKFTALQDVINEYQNQLNVKVVANTVLRDVKELAISSDLIDSIVEVCNEQLTKIKKSKEKNSASDIYSKIKIASHAYAQIKQLNIDKAGYEKQRNTMGQIYKMFLDKQQAALEDFLDNFSEKINQIYQFLNPDEKVDNIRLVPLTKENELSGITIQFDFFDTKKINPPHKYLSESHLHCLGIAFFLSSVEAFNKNNKFIILDDIISSFDANHRKRFADLLIEEYSDYQIILLTHEESWFDIVRNKVNGKQWKIHSLKHTGNQGTYIDEASALLEEKIKNNIESQDADGLGNNTRKLLEYRLKHIAVNLQVTMPFRFNDKNEDRMSSELLKYLQSTLKEKCQELKNKPDIVRLIDSTFIGNKVSHDTNKSFTFSDVKAFHNDVQTFSKLFFCTSCTKPLAIKNYDDVQKEIRCSNGCLSYSWNG